MKTNQKTVILTLFSAIIMMGLSLSGYAGHTPESGQSIEQVSLSGKTVTPNDVLPSDGKGAAKGCATGATIGTAIAPGVGTLAGCIIAGVWGWFW